MKKVSKSVHFFPLTIGHDFRNDKEEKTKIIFPPIHPSFSDLLCYPLHSSSQDTQRKQPAIRTGTVLFLYQPAIRTGTVLFFVYLAKIGSTKLDCAIIPSPLTYSYHKGARKHQVHKHQFLNLLCVHTFKIEQC